MRILTVATIAVAVAVGQAQTPDLLQKRCRDMFDEAVRSGNPDIRKEAAEALSLLGVKDSLLGSLESMLDDHDVVVRTAAVASLGDFSDSTTVPLLKKALEDPVPEVDFAAAKALYQLHDPEGERFLLEVVAGESKASSSYVAREERKAQHLLHTPTKLFTTAAIGAAGFVPVPGLGLGLSSAQGILSDPDSSARAAALLLLGNRRDPAVADAVRAALSDKEWSVRAAAVQVVATHPYPALRRDLTTLLDDKKDAVRLRAAAAYIRLERGGKRPPSGSRINQR